MSPLNIEVYNPQRTDWVKVQELNPGDSSDSISQNKPDGQREVYLFQCEPSGEESVIYRSRAGFDVANQRSRVVNTTGLEEVARLKDGESHQLSVKTDVSDTERLVRFTHLKNKTP